MQRLQSVPPQSTSDSLPFSTVSVQLAATQTLPLQIRLAQSVVATQRLPFAHAVHIVPPQSASLSSAFILPSVQEVHVPAVQRFPAQSVAAAQCLPSGHLAQVVAPPQSTSVSPPFTSLSTHEMQTPLRHFRFRQSVSTRQIFPSTHAAHSAPPQSMSTSSPFLIVSLHDEQSPWSQRPPVQSLLLAHVLPSAHLEQAEPPQSLSVSPWFFTVSVHVGVEQTPAEQT